MSNTRAIAAVTETLKSILGRVMDPIGIDAPDADLSLDVNISSKPPEVARSGDKKNQLNLFLYQIAPNAAFRNLDLASQGKSSVAQLPLALTLYYMVTAYGGTDEDSDAHRLLGRAMALLQQNSVLNLADIQAALKENDLHQQIERVRVNPHYLSTEEMSKLWTTFQAGYRLSVAYEVSVVLVDNPIPATTALPVLTRGPLDEGVFVEPSLRPQTPTLLSVTPPNGQPAARLGVLVPATGGDELVYAGINLAPGTVTIDFTHVTQAAHQSVPPASVTATELQLTLTSDQTHWPAGFYRTSVRVDAHPSNEVFLAIAPRITSIGVLPPLPDGTRPIVVGVSPEVWPDQKVILILADQEFHLGSRTTSLATLTFNIPNPAAGTYFVRLRVDGVESLLIDFAAPTPSYDPSQQVTVP